MDSTRPQTAPDNPHNLQVAYWWLIVFALARKLVAYQMT
jgi:hypothetical protein